MEREIVFHRKDLSLLIQGVWRVSSLQVFHKDLSTVIKKHASELKSIKIDKDAILDVGVLKSLLGVLRDYEKSGTKIILDIEGEAHKKLLSLVSSVPVKNVQGLSDDTSGFLESVGEKAEEIWNETLSLLSFVAGILKELLLIIVFPHRFRVREIISQIDYTGVNAIPICALVTFLIGIVIAYLMGNQLQYYGANIFVVDGISVAMCRELSPILVAIIIAGRSGSAFAAQLGSMRLNQEVEALQVMGLSSFSVLIIPRIVALMITMPILVVVGDIFGILGGLCISYIHLEVSPENFIERLKMVLSAKHIYVGLAKAPLFALFIASIGCRLGLDSEPNAVSIGQNTTKAVVQGIVSVILLNAAVAIFLTSVGI